MFDGAELFYPETRPEPEPDSYPLTERGADWWGGTDLTNLNSLYVNRESRHHWYTSTNPCWSNPHLLRWEIPGGLPCPTSLEQTAALYLHDVKTVRRPEVLSLNLWGFEIAGSSLAKGPVKTNAAAKRLHAADATQSGTEPIQFINRARGPEWRLQTVKRHAYAAILTDGALA